MGKSLRSWWRNCAVDADPEIQAIDEIEDRMVPLDPNISKIRDLISALEVCHHKADRWVDNILEAIGTGKTQKGLGTRPPTQQHPIEKIWHNACAALQAWCAGCPITEVDLIIDNMPASRLLSGLGDRSPLKEWQAQRVIDKIRSVIHWQQSDVDPSSHYEWLLLSGGEYEAFYRSDCPQHYKEHEDFWLKTVKTIIRDTVNGEQAELSLGLAIDMLWPCHWDFAANLQLVLAAIGGELNPERPFTACGRNIDIVPNRERLEVISRTLNSFCGDSKTESEIDREILIQLGEPDEGKKWLAASLDKTIRLQLVPPAALRTMSALDGPAWIKQ
jgi:hypothetical protein